MNGLLTRENVAAAMAEYGTVEQVRKNRFRVSTHPQKVLGAVKAAQELLGCDHLIAISTTDRGEAFGLDYHLTGPHRTVITVAIDVSRVQPQTFTVSDILPPAGIYERQVHDLFGIVFIGHPALKRLVLNEDWPDDEFPLRKDWKPGERTAYGGIPPEAG